MLFVVAAICLGSAGCWSGWNGLTGGRITIHRKFKDSFVAYASGPHQAEFELEVHLRIWGGALLAVLGVALAAILLLGSPERRGRMLEAERRMFARRQSMQRIPAWLFWSVIGVFIACLIYAAAGA